LQKEENLRSCNPNTTASLNNLCGATAPLFATFPVKDYGLPTVPLMLTDRICKPSLIEGAPHWSTLTRQMIVQSFLLPTHRPIPMSSTNLKHRIARFPG